MGVSRRFRAYERRQVEAAKYDGALICHKETGELNILTYLPELSALYGQDAYKIESETNDYRDYYTADFIFKTWEFIGWVD